MPVVLAAVLAVAGFVWWSWGRRRAGDEVAFRLDSLFRRKPCKWKATGDAKGALEDYQCAVCGVTAFSRTGQGPVDCKRSLRGGL
ncbi:hypothetical protein SAMN04488002_2707 [Litoreibacter janthinus]|uniref:Uncharacterized protein n=1 Tax=Litoreibacter janthinus TaxID=670154 RepID=A0A1I6H9U9_9RHOB|nr:hypothetical protein SAMN04488002_2707 [Litoreibacter janthinus]